MRVVQDFSQGKMNMDVAARYMPKGQYREAKNVRVIDTDDDNSGIIESIDGSLVVVDEPLWTSGSRTAGMYEYNNKIYLFTALRQGGFSILEHDSITGKSSHVFVDQMSTMKDVFGMKNTICFLHNKRDSDTIFQRALETGFGWYVPSKEEIKEAVDSMISTAKVLISESDKEIVDFNDKNIVVGQAVEVEKPVTRSNADSVNYYWSSTEVDEEAAFAYGNGGDYITSDKNTKYFCLLIRKFRYDVEPEIGSIYDGGSVYKVDKKTREAWALRLLANRHMFDDVHESFIQELITPFNLKTEISGFAMMNNIMIFNDWMVNDPIQIDITKTKGYYKFYDWTAMKLVKRPPMDVKVEIAEKSELSEMRNLNPVFAARYVYDTRETSAISPYSRASSELDIDSSKKVSFDMTAEVYIYNNRITIYWDKVNPEDGDMTSQSYVSFDLPIGQSYADTIINDFKAVPYNVSEKGFEVKGVLCLTTYMQNAEVSTYRNGYFIYFDTYETQATKIVEKFYANFNDGGDLNVNGNLVYFARTGGFSGSNNSGLWLQQYNPSDGSYGEVRGFESSGDKYNGDICMSADGKYCYVMYKSNFAYSHDYGKLGTWKETNINDFAKIGNPSRGETVICNSDGSVVYISVNNNFDTNAKWTFVSRDYGKTFELAHAFNTSERYPESYNKVMACSADGKFLAIAGQHINTLYYSSEFGNNMQKSTVNLTGLEESKKYRIKSISTSPTARVIYVVVQKDNTSYVLMSNDFGKTYSIQNYLTKTGTFAGAVTYVKGESYSNEVLNEISNSTSAVDITVNTGNEHVRKIELLMKTGAGMYKVKTIDKEKEKLEDNVDYTYRFTYSGNYPLVAIKDVNKLFDNVPLKARSCMIIQNSVLFGGYMDGFNIDTDIELSVKIDNVKASDITYSLKTGVTQGYGIVLYDDFGRCSPVLSVAEATADRINADTSSIGRLARITVKGKAPSWAKYFKFARRNPRLYFDVINGFDNAYVFNDKVYLEITSMPWVVPNAGDKLELISELETLSDKVSDKGYIFEIKDRVMVQGEAGSLSVTLSDGTKVDIGDSEKQGIPNGRYIIIDYSGREGYTRDDIINKKSRFTSSVFYVMMYKEDTSSDVVYQEIPGIHEIRDGIAGTYTLSEDGDVLIGDSPAREINRFTNGTIFSTLGRPNAISENYSQEDRYASLTVSEPYVEDTKDNGFSSFNTSLVNFKDLGKKYGEIVKIDEIGTDIDVYQRNKCSRVMYKKNIITSADGNPIIAKSEDAFGEQQFYAEDAGMSSYKTYAKHGNSRFFVDTYTGQVFRNTLNGLFAISSYGMQNFFHDYLTNMGVICGGYDPKNGSYIVGLRNDCVNFMEKIDGWTSFYDMSPDWMARSGANLFLSKDSMIRIHAGDPNNQNLMLGQNFPSYVHIVNNEYPEVNKVYNNIILESNMVPKYLDFSTNDLSSEINDKFFVKKEHLYESYIPKDTSDGDPVLLFIDEEPFTGNELQVINHEELEVGEKVYIEGEEVAEITAIDGDKITLSDDIIIRAYEALYFKRDNSVEGDAIRGKYLEIISYFSVEKTNKLLLKSLQLDIDESKF